MPWASGAAEPRRSIWPRLWPEDPPVIRYYLLLALRNLKATPALTGLMVVTVALGIGVFMAALTVYYLMATNPIPHKSDRLFAVQLDSWDPAQPYDDERPSLPPWELTYRDAQALMESDLPVRHAAMYKVSLVIQPERPEIKPFMELGRVTGGDFFGLFDIPFLYGGSWGDTADREGERVAVIGAELNDRLYGGEDSVGRTLNLNDNEFRIVGVIPRWNPTPKFYDTNNGAFEDAEQIFIPAGTGPALELFSAGNTNCWKDEQVENFEDFLGTECVWWQFWAELETAGQRQAYQAFLDNYVRTQKELGRFGRPLNNTLTPVDEWLEVRRVVRRDNKVLVGLSFLFLGVCLFNAVGLMLTRFAGRAPQIGIRRALGARKRAVFSQQLIEVGAIGAVGGLLGLGFAWLALLGVRRLFPQYERLAELDLVMVAVAIVAAVTATTLAGLYPAWRVCRVPPAAYLRIQ
jgi:putative ABC transport system permease protein